MFVHIGDNVVLPVKDIVGIFDVSILEDKATKDFLQISEEEGFVKNLGDDRRSSFILTTQNIYFSPISSGTLKKRIDNLYDYDEAEFLEEFDEQLDDLYNEYI